ncbi:hypothetical protein EJ357_24890 [Streptomyces cyaneochromogenes]|uniref:Uncharacterized protein n=1 Tax=Streptomyces cyaneochromogenes TaxID=2496836 RepID=A0A3Q9EP91_9ACTN|nr:hypothetical protein EJ357_24890 [Streptomyces cyaneochromogenes]
MSAKSRLPRDAWHALSLNRAKAHVQPVRGLPPGTPRARSPMTPRCPPSGRTTGLCGRDLGACVRAGGRREVPGTPCSGPTGVQPESLVGRG